MHKQFTNDRLRLITSLVYGVVMRGGSLKALAARQLFAIRFTILFVSSFAFFYSTLTIATVFLPDDRRDFLAQTQPWQAIGKVELIPEGHMPNSSQKGVQFCTGSLISKDLVLTNAHCVLESNGLTRQTIWFRPNIQKSNNTRMLAAPVAKVWLGTMMPDHHRADDWALLKLKIPLGNRVGWFEVKDYPDQFLVSDESNKTSLIAYAMDYNHGKQLMIHSGCSINGFGEREPYLRHDCDMNGGSSGGPMFWFENDSPFIIAVNAAHTTKEKVSYFNHFRLDRANIAVSSHRFYHILQSLKENNWFASLYQLAFTIDLGHQPDKTWPTNYPAFIYY